MPRAVPAPLRQRLAELHRQGQPVPAIALTLGLSPRTVRRLVQFSQQRGAEALQPAYRHCGRQPQDTTAVLDCRRQHPTWGAPYIRVVLAEQGQDDLPSARTLQRHLQQAGLQPAQRGRRSSAYERAGTPHLGWQLDASERIRLRTGQECSWLRAVDEYSGAFLRTTVFPPRLLATSPATAEPRVLAQAFACWGRPQRLRVDNGTPWGATDGLPPSLVLWLAGLGVRVEHNPPRRPQNNGVVERSQGTGKNWAEPGQCASVAELQRRLDEADERQRQHYPYRDGQSRLEVFPGLRHSGRAYSRDWERRHWQLALAEDVLAELVVERQVDQAGSVSLYSRNRYVGKAWRGQRVWVRYDPESHYWTFSDHDNRLLAYKEAPELSRERIVNLTATDGRSKRK